MPEFFRLYLLGLGNDRAKALWEWVDSTPGVSEDMITTLAESHLTLAEQLCGPREPEKKRRA